MTDKTKEAIRKAVYELDDQRITATEALAKICAIVDEERKGKRGELVFRPREER